MDGLPNELAALFLLLSARLLTRYMKENKYDDSVFFEKYGVMSRSIGGLESAGEWPALKSILPDLANKRVLDLGCGYGWHCRYAVAHNAKTVTGVDISEKMLLKAKSMTDAHTDAIPPRSSIHYIHASIEDIEFKENSFDIIIKQKSSESMAKCR